MYICTALVIFYKNIYIYIIQGLIGLSFNLKDPNKYLSSSSTSNNNRNSYNAKSNKENNVGNYNNEDGGGGSEGITIALLERDHPGLIVGKRHDPLIASFMNGTVEGKDVFIPMKQIVGGQKRCGFGWNMLMVSFIRMHNILQLLQY